MEDFIYIIALIAWVVFAFYRKSQKKNEAARDIAKKSQHPEMNRPSPSWEDILLGRESLPEEELEPELVSSSQTDGVAPARMETLFEKEYKRRGISSIEEVKTTNTRKEAKPIELLEDELEVEVLNEENWLHDVDLRKAVIYSEILNRPYV